LADEKTYKATYVGSGTFIISKPKRNRRKLRQARVRCPQRGARKFPSGAISSRHAYQGWRPALQRIPLRTSRL